MSDINQKIAIVVSKFNTPVVDPLLLAAKKTFKDRGISEDQIVIYEVPGAFEIPLCAKKLAQKADVCAVLGLGAVIRGETPHFDYVSLEAARGIQSVMLETEKPIIFGVLTCDTAEQAFDRSGGSRGNKGADTAIALLDLLNTLNAIEML